MFLSAFALRLSVFARVCPYARRVYLRFSVLRLIMSFKLKPFTLFTIFLSVV